MTDIAQEISTDYDLDSVDGNGEDPFETIVKQLADFENLDQEITQLLKTTDALESFGLTPTSFSEMKTSQLLAGTSLEAIAVESFSVSGPQDPECQMALEALGDKIKEKMASWAAKIVSLVKNSVSKILNVLESLKNKIVEKGQQLASKTWDMTKTAGQTIKAHPYKTVFAAVGAAIAVMAIVGLAAAPGTYASVDSMRAFTDRMRAGLSNIKMPFDKMKVDVVTEVHNNTTWCHVVTKNTDEITETIAVTKVYSQVELGYTQTAIKMLLNQFSKLWSSTRTTLGSLGTTILGAAKKVNDIGGDMPAKVGEKVAGATKSKLAGWGAQKWVEKIYVTILFSIIGSITALLKNVVMKAFHMVLDTFNSLRVQYKTA